MAEQRPGGPELPGAANLVAKTFEDGGKHFTAVSITFWLTCLYVLITVSSTDHQELLLGATPKLPVLNVSISLKAFFIVAPLLILVLHLHLLLQNHVLVLRLQHRRIRDLLGDESFFLFPSLPVLREVLSTLQPFVAKLVWLSLWITNVLLPLFVLCVVQGVFRPYHSLWITSCHQIFIVIDLVIAWCFLVVFFPSRDREGRWWTVSRFTGMAVTLLVLLYSFVLAVVPGTWIEIWTGKHRLADLVPRNLDLRPRTQEVSLAGAILVGRDLRGADFDGAILEGADFRGADLTLAILEGTDLRKANLGPLEVKTPILTQERSAQKIKEIEEEIRKGLFKPTRLNGANLKNAKLEGASLILANLTRADLSKARLRGVELTGASLRLAHLREADLAGAELTLARMEGADLSEAHLEGATLDRAFLAGASLNQANAAASSFASANLEGARLTETVLKAATFFGAELAGSDFRRGFLQGASSLQLRATDLRGAHVGGVCGVSMLHGLNDFRFVDLSFLSMYDWESLRLDVKAKLDGIPEKVRNSVLDRIDEAASRVDPGRAEEEARGSEATKSGIKKINDAKLTQIACLGTLLSSPLAQRSLGFLKLDADHNIVAEASVATNRTWNEAVFHKELAEELLRRACESRGLASTVTSRAAGEYNPGDRELDLELAKQLLVKLRDPNCRMLQNVTPQIRQQIEWRLRKQARNQARKEEEGL